jgi:hypothetical protein
MMNANLVVGILVLGVSQLLVSCAGGGSWGQHPHCPVVPVSTTDHLGKVNLRARMHFSMNGRKSDFEVIARRAPDELVVVGIAQHGVRLFAVHQRGREFEVEGASSRRSTRLARLALDALHRAIWIPTPPDPGAGAVVDWNWENESVTDSIGGGQRRREFAHPDASDSVVILYASPSAGGGERVEIQNPWCGYEARFVVFDTPKRGGR